MARIGVLTGGGDCPGLNAVIRAVVRKGIKVHGHDFLGFRYGWAGVLAGDCAPLSYENTRGILHRGGTILGTSRTNPYKEEGGLEKLKAVLAEQQVDALIPIGGEDTLGVARRLMDDGVNVVGVPKTIDNDLAGTDFTFGFQTAVQIATDAIDRLHTTAESHNRVIVVEVMGRTAGWIACYSGMAGGADVILVPERPFDIEEVCERVRHRHDSGHSFSIVVVAEGATPKDGEVKSEFGGGTDAFGHVRLGGIAVHLEREIEERTGYESRMTILGHVQRGGTPLAYDRVLGTRFGVAAVEAASAGTFGKMVALRGTEIELVPLEEALAEPKLLDPRLFETAEVFFG
jgi:ATP-dependent phosphofructokinase / diphosphate-dependent phosphofructokinase